MDDSAAIVDKTAFSGEPPVGMPEAQVQTCLAVRDMIYLSAHDASFASMTGERMVQMLTHHAGHDQFLVVRRNNWPVAFAIWARMSEESLRKLMSKGYGALDPSDLHSGDKLVLTGICSPWRREDFEVVFAACSRSLDDGTGNGGWYVVLPAINDMPKRLARFRRTSPTAGLLEEARL